MLCGPGRPAGPHLPAMARDDLARIRRGATSERFVQPGLEGLRFGCLACPRRLELRVATGSGDRQRHRLDANLLAQPSDEMHRGARKCMAVRLDPERVGCGSHGDGHCALAFDRPGDHRQQVVAAHLAQQPVRCEIGGRLGCPHLELPAQSLGLLPHDADELLTILGLHVGIVRDGLDRGLDAAQRCAGRLGELPQQVIASAAGFHPLGQVFEEQHETGDLALGPVHGCHLDLEQPPAVQGGGHVRGRGRGADASHRVLEQVPVDDVEDRPAESDCRVVLQNRSRGGVVEKNPSVHVADQDRDSELGHQRGQSIPLLLETHLGGGDLGGDLAFGYATPFGKRLH